LALAIFVSQANGSLEEDIRTVLKSLASKLPIAETVQKVRAAAEYGIETGAIKDSLDNLNSHQDQLILFINESGEKGVLLNVVIYRHVTPTETQYYFSPLLPGGVGQNPNDAAFKSLISDQKLPEHLPDILGKEGLPPEGWDRDISDLSFGLWIQKSENGSLIVSPLRDVNAVYTEATQLWVVYKGQAAVVNVGSDIAKLHAEAQTYGKLESLYREAAYQRGVEDTLETLVAGQEKLRKAYETALVERENAAARQKKYQDWSTVATLLGVASAAAAASESSETAKADYQYEKTVVQQYELQYTDGQNKLRLFFQKEFDVDPKKLP
jgi:hypothetical protein